jgi:hypothetical protein
MTSSAAIEETGGGRSWARRTLLWGRWCLLMVPLTILLHELGHLAAAVSVGFPDPALHFSSTSQGDVTKFAAWTHGVVGLAGPAVTVMLALFACGWIALRGCARWAFALLVASVSRFAVGVPYTLINSFVRLTGRRLTPPAFDEHKAATALGWSGDAVLGSTSVLLIAALVWMGFRLPRGERSVAWPGLLLGTALGWVLWMQLLGPVLLP